MKKGLLIVVSGPAGSGKGTVNAKLLQSDEYAFSVSATTRAPRAGEVDGKNYYYITKEEFERRIEAGEMLEHTLYCGNYYGTPLEAIEERLALGQDIILEIEAQGALKVMEKKPDAVSIFIAPPDTEALYERLRGRGTESQEEIERRVKASEWELAQKDKYKYVVVNDDLDTAVAAIENIMKNERETI